MSDLTFFQKIEGNLPDEVADLSQEFILRLAAAGLTHAQIAETFALNLALVVGNAIEKKCGASLGPQRLSLMSNGIKGGVDKLAALVVKEILRAN